MLCDLYGSVPYIDEDTKIKDIPEQWSRKQIFDFTVNTLLDLQNELKEPETNEKMPFLLNHETIF